MGREKVLVAMSGGVDSSVTAALLADRGFDVVGVTMKLFCYSDTMDIPPEKSCCSLDSARAAMSVAEKLGILHTVLDMQGLFKEEVLVNFFEEYSRGRTPNPCILCNSRLRFHHLLRRGDAIGARYLATGHYARIVSHEGSGGITHTLERASYREKDQSYFLWQMNQETLARSLFPLGDLTKPQVREIARSMDLEVAEKPESQDFCLLALAPPSGHRTGRPLSWKGLAMAPEAGLPGPILDTAGNRIGTHRGIAHYTTGQRRGLGLSLGKPAYVVRIIPESNTLVVGIEEDLAVTEFTVSGVNWISVKVPESPISREVKVRSRSEPVPALITPTGRQTARIRLGSPKNAVTPGQSAVWYDGSVLEGGGVID
jgi:tRNA-specific 2-thiouridylase